jgi:hypothetical protein
MNFSQCPGEYYSEFPEDDEPTINVDELIENYKSSEWYKENTQYLITFYHKQELSKRYNYHRTMKDALEASIQMIETDSYIVESITTEYPTI